MAQHKRPTAQAGSTVERTGADLRVSLSGDWSSSNAEACESEAERILAASTGARAVALDLGAIVRLDTLGVWVISRLCHEVRQRGGSARLDQVQPTHRILFEEIQYRPLPDTRRKGDYIAIDLLADIGKAMVDSYRDLVSGISFLGAFVSSLAVILTGRSRFRIASLVAQLERVALRSVPIIILISVLVGGIIAQQSVFQMRAFGTVHFVADLLGVLVLRELAVLITSIMIAGRTGSSFTAELGSMKMREEIDALRTMGRDPVEILVVPRIVALLIGMPLLTFISSMAMLVGGGLVTVIYGGVSPEIFLSRLQNGIGVNTFVVGMVKAPFMALVIGVIACIEGFAVQGSAESLGTRTTASVVKAIFMVIVVDGLFAMFFATIRY